MRISQKEWEKRLEEVKLASEDCKTIKEIIEITDYSRPIIKYIFEKFPEEAKVIRSNLEKNNGKTKKNKNWKPDYKKRIVKILEASKTCESFVELSKVTGFSDFIIRNTLSKFPEKEAIVRKNLGKDKSSNVAICKDDKSLDKSQKNKEFSVVMLDTSINHAENIFQILEEYVQNGKILGITDVVLEELAKSQHKSASNLNQSARDFLYILMDNISAFKLFEVKHSMKERETPDEAIIEATLNLKGEAILLTSDKEMYIKTLLKGGKARILLDKEREPKKFKCAIKEQEVEVKELKNRKKITFIDAHEEEGKLFFKRKKRRTQIVKVIARNGEEKQGDEIELEIGDHIFICTKREDYISFLDYEVYFLKEDGFLEKFHTKSYNCDAIVSIENYDYKKFIEQARKALIE